MGTCTREKRWLSGESIGWQFTLGMANSSISRQLAKIAAATKSESQFILNATCNALSINFQRSFEAVTRTKHILYIRLYILVIRASRYVQRLLFEVPNYNILDCSYGFEVSFLIYLHTVGSQSGVCIVRTWTRSTKWRAVPAVTQAAFPQLHKHCYVAAPNLMSLMPLFRSVGFNQHGSAGKQKLQFLLVLHH